jgi:hypothetical protein
MVDFVPSILSDVDIDKSDGLKCMDNSIIIPLALLFLYFNNLLTYFAIIIFVSYITIPTSQFFDSGLIRWRNKPLLGG